MPFLDRQGCMLAYDSSGSGEPVLLIHGFALDRSSMGGIAHDLAGRYRAVTLDLRGHGESTRNLDPSDYKPDVLRGDILEMIERVCGAPAHLIGHSFGGQLALDAALRRSDLVRSLTLICSGPFRRVKTSDEKLLWENTAAYFSKCAPDKLNFALCANTLLGAPKSVVLDLPALYKNADGKNLAAMIRGSFLSLEENETACASLKLPILILAGGKDPEWAERSRSLANVAPDSRFVCFPNAGHLAHLEYPEETVEEILAFLSNL
ncbi:alpha/beta hydrolase [Candidatus Sumerlaeota bacterium]|nr:alpha/beta hydrolase [Candidatus Sumerlaeota bacterium]